MKAKKAKKRMQWFSGWERLEDREVLSSMAMMPPPMMAPSGGPGSVAPPVPVLDVRSAQQAFQAFNQTYTVDMSTVLFAKGADGQVNPSANLAAFDADVDSALEALDASLESIVADMKNGANLASTIKGTLVGPGPQTVQSQLQATTAAAVASAPASASTTASTTPAVATTSASRLIQIKSASIIDAVAAQITLDLLESTPLTTMIADPAPAIAPSTALDASGTPAVSTSTSSEVSGTLRTPVSPTLTVRLA